MKKILKIAGLVVVGFLVIVILYFFFEPQSWKNEREAKASANLNDITERIAKLKNQLPQMNEDKVGMSFQTDTLDWSKTLTISVHEINCFVDTTLMIENPLPWGPWQSPLVQTFIESYQTLPKYRNAFKEIDDGEEIMKRRFIMIYHPIYYRQPKVNNNNKTFLPGFFDGWMIYFDMQKGKALGYVRFQSFTKLTEIKGEGLGIGIDPIPVSIPIVNTTNFDQVLQDDFKKEFFRKSDSVFHAFKASSHK